MIDSVVTPLSRVERLWLRLAVAGLWLSTGLMVFHPFFSAVGLSYLDRLYLPHWLMTVTCGAQVALGVRLLLSPPTGWSTALQVVMVSGSTIILGGLEPMLLVHPFGMLSKNLPFLALVVAAFKLEREGWSPSALRWLRAGMAVVWITEGIVPKLLFQQSMERVLVVNSGLVPMDPTLFLYGLGVLEALSGVAALTLKGNALWTLLYAQAAALIVLPIGVAAQFPLLIFHPFGPFTKNIPILIGTFLLAGRLGVSSVARAPSSRAVE